MSGRWVNIEREQHPDDPRRPWGWSTVAKANGALVRPGHARTMVGARFAAWWAARATPVVTCRCRSHHERTGTHVDECPLAAAASS